ncbi:MAG: hypothetical protein Q8K11_02760 [Phenylobacterium sp.]|uniref:hypothetical protein n=1 Tax=Phenylobacterium sp. TaxID=1871053 RepID=UPI00273013A7|nr:hypothetical protein [Phenylobacterium sp.]MDP2009077.1 hypothetical protein [Phenylobacterium sp.]
MRTPPPPNPLTTVSVWIAAIFIALREGAAMTPSLAGLAAAMGGAWSYLPLAVLILAAVVYLMRTVFDPNARTLPPPVFAARPAPEAEKPPEPPPPEAGKPPEPPAPRIFLSPHNDVAQLLGVGQGQTHYQAERAFEPFVGKWMHVQGQFGDLLQLGLPTEPQYVVHLDSNDRASRPPLSLTFDPDWLDRLTILQRGQNIRVAGRVSSRSFGVLNLNHCELERPE